MSEVIEEWMATQRKWLYLEGIFVGGDIRVQLPDEAKKFDDIDRNFRKVCCYMVFLSNIFITFHANIINSKVCWTLTAKSLC